MGPTKVLDIPAPGWLTAVACGFLASVAILNFQHGVRFGKISTSWLIINLSTALPTVLSILIYREAVSVRRALGLGRLSWRYRSSGWNEHARSDRQIAPRRLPCYLGIATGVSAPILLALPD